MILKNFCKKINKIIIFFIVFCGIIAYSDEAYAITLIDYNKYIEEGRLYNLGNFDARYNPNVLKYRKYGHFTYDGVIRYPSGNPEVPWNDVNGDRILADQAISTDETYKVTGQFDYDGMDYSYYDMEGLNPTERNRYEFQSRLDSLVISDRKSDDQGYGAYNLRAGKNIVAFINFAYDFYKNQSGEKRVGCESKEDLAARGITSGDICPMEALKGYQGLSHTNVDAFDYNIFNILFRKCTTEWEYQGNKTIANSNSIFANLQYYYMALVYLQPGLKKFKSMRPNDFNSMDSDDNAAFLSMMFERFGGRPIIPENYEARNMVNRLGEIGEYEILPALVDDKLGFTVGERIYRYMIEIKWKNNPEALARWISEYNEVYGEYEILSAEDYAIFKKACDEVYRKHANSRSADTALDFGYVIDPSKFESRISFDDAVAAMADHYQHNLQDSQFYKNRNNAEYVAKTYAMVKAMCENDAFTDITDIYACIVNLVEHSYGYDSTEILLTDTQVVHLMANLNEGDYDTDQDNLLDRQELDHEENVNISNLLEEYIKYNRLPEEEANKLRADPYIKMWAYKSNPALPDTDFDGRNDDYDFHRPLENKQVGKMSTLNYDSVNFDYCQDYRYFFMPSTQYYYELSEMSMVLANMVNKKSGINRRWNKDTNYVNRIADDGGGITTNSYRETYNTNGIAGYMNYIGLDDIEEYDMSNTVGDPNVCRYAIGHRDVVYSLGRTQNVVRNVIAISIGDIEANAAELYANFDGHSGREGDYTEYHHVGFDIVANRILETIERYASRYDPRYQKVYWITGEGGGGSVANLLAQKMIKKYGNKNIYCYTFQALNTINCNNIPAVQRISNEPYGSIFNLYNDDNQVLQIYTNEANFYMYGVRRHVAVSSSNSYMQDWYNATGIRYPIITNIDYVGDFLDIVFEKPYNSSDGIVIGHSETQLLNDIVGQHIEIYKLFKRLRDIKPNNNYNIENANNVAITLLSYFSSLKGNTSSLTNPLDQMQYNYYIFQMRSIMNENMKDAIKESAGIPKCFYDKVTVEKALGSYGAIYEVEELDKRDGYPFSAYRDYNISKEENEGYNNSSEETVMIKPFMYSNYTLKGVPYKEINYVKFWYEGNINKPLNPKGELEQLFKYKAGDMNGTTKCTYGDYEGKAAVTAYMGTIVEDDRLSLGNGHKLVTIDNRIIAAFPQALFSEDKNDFDAIRKNMHMVKSYNEPDENDPTNGGNHKQSGTISARADLDWYKLIDVVIEDSNGQQFVVPFILIDAKSLHLLPNIDINSKKGNFSNFTDNRYGHVVEQITDSNPKEYSYYKYHINDTANGNTAEIWFDETQKDAAEGHIAMGGNMFTYLGKKKTYYDRNDERTVTLISPIEPYIYLEKGEDGKPVNVNGLNEIITSVICGKGITTAKPNCKIVSMRLYDERLANANGVLQPGTWDSRQAEIEYKPNFFEELAQNGSNKKNIIVDYK